MKHGMHPKNWIKKKKQSLVTITLVDEKGQFVAVDVVVHSDHLEDRMEACSDFTKVLEYPNLSYEVNEKKAKWRTSTETPPSPCVYFATEEYLKNLFGINLHQTDKDWFNTHGALLPGGVPTNNTLRVVQELIDPYGLRIIRVKILPKLHIRGDLLQWFGVLGINPLGAANRQTSNASFSEQTGLSLADCNAMFCIEYDDEPLKPGIICAGPGDNVTGQTELHGHASYIPVRGKKPGGHIDMRIQLGRQVDYPWLNGPPVFEPLEPRGKMMELDLWKMLPYELYKQSSFYASTVHKGQFQNHPAPVGGNNDLCALCPGEHTTRRVANTIYMNGKYILCHECYSLAWVGYTCTKCQHDFSDGVNYQPCTNGQVRVRCGNCDNILSAPEKVDSNALRILIGIAKGIMPGKEARKIFRGHRRAVLG